MPHARGRLTTTERGCKMLTACECDPCPRAHCDFEAAGASLAPGVNVSTTQKSTSIRNQSRVLGEALIFIECSQVLAGGAVLPIYEPSMHIQIDKIVPVSPVLRVHPMWNA